MPPILKKMRAVPKTGLNWSCFFHLKEWLNNKESMLKYMESVHLGVKGLVVDQDSQPINNAIVS